MKDEQTQDIEKTCDTFNRVHVKRIVGGFFCRNSDLDFKIAVIVFNINPDLYKWGLPCFSEDRNAAAMVNTAILGKDEAVIEKYDKELERIAIKRGWKTIPQWSGLSTFLTFIMPEDICKAAIIACSGRKAVTSL